MAEKGRTKAAWDAYQVRALRQHLKVTQQQMAQELGTRQQTISEWETGMYRPRGTSNTLLTIIAERSRFEYRVEPQEEVPATSGRQPRRRSHGPVS